MLNGLALMDDLLASTDQWCQCSNARDAKGKAVAYSNDESAVCWCINGAGNRCNITDQERQALHAVVFKRGYNNLAIFNDTPGRKFAEVKEVIREARYLLYGEYVETYVEPRKNAVTWVVLASLAALPAAVTLYYIVKFFL